MFLVLSLFFVTGLADKHCEVNKTVYWNGDKVQQYDSSVHECITCECSQGQLKYCTIADCPDISKCSGDSYTPEGQCCPICKRRCKIDILIDRWFSLTWLVAILICETREKIEAEGKLVLLTICCFSMWSRTKTWRQVVLVAERSKGVLLLSMLTWRSSGLQEGVTTLLP